MRDARQIRLIVSDVDGVWTDGRIIYAGQTREIKEFNVRDGLAVKLAQRAGLPVAVITSRHSSALRKRCEELGIEDLVERATDKLAETRKIAERRGLSLEEVCYVGDDLPDLAPIRACGLSAAPSDAAVEVREAVKWRLEARGGAGALRELIERLLRERGDWQRIVEEFGGSTIAAPTV